ncbi:MAG: CapA family protein [Candidatus Lambdaproteobacteria bacterium]|nr:CapA family protein [Candidatus Lambdaproteobacteria bacterium]
MAQTLILTGDVNLRDMADPPRAFSQVAGTLHGAVGVFGNLECLLAERPAQRPPEGFYAGAAAGRALQVAGYHAVGTANNVNYGTVAIPASLAVLDGLGIAHTGSGVNRQAAWTPVVVERGGLRFGFIQHTCVYWSLHHEATDKEPGVAALRAHTAYRPRVEQLRALTRPGMAPEVVTWADAEALGEYRAAVAALRARADVVVASVHWGLDTDVFQYMREIAQAAIEAGADLVLGHGPHSPLGVGLYRDRPILYGMGNFAFDVGHYDRRHGDWIGLLARVELEGERVAGLTLAPVRHNAHGETVLRSWREEADALATQNALCAPLGTRLEAEGDAARVRPAG